MDSAEGVVSRHTVLWEGVSIYFGIYMYIYMYMYMYTVNPSRISYRYIFVLPQTHSSLSLRMEHKLLLHPLPAQV